MALTKDQIIAADDLGMLRVEVPQWRDAEGNPGVVFIRVMSVGERDAYEREWIGKRETGVENFRAKFLARCLCDENGRRLFTDEDVVLLANKSALVCGELWRKAMVHNALMEGDVEELAKN